MIRLHYIQHVPFETPGSIINWANSVGASLSSSRLYDNESLPDPGSFDCLVVMGGPMGVHDEPKYGWLKDEKKFIAAAVDSGKRVIGICLGAQLICDALGTRVTRNKQKEIGWFPVQVTGENRSLKSTGFLPASFNVFHWHGDTFDIPDGSVKIASSEGCENQGFVYGERVIGLQFHLEVTEPLIKEMVNNGRQELIEDRYVQNEDTILGNTRFIGANNEYMSSIMTNLTKGL